MIKKMLLLCVSIICLKMTYAQKDSAAHTLSLPSPISITGSVDGYYRYNFDVDQNNITSFTNSSNSFELGMASIIGDHSFGKGGITVDLGFGRRAAEYSYNDSSSKNNLLAIKQAFIYYQSSSKLKFTFGKWGTHIGFEVLDAYNNRNYSMDYMFTFCPFFHTGIKADVTIDSNWSYMFGLANPSDFSTTSSSTKTLLAQLSHTNKAGTWKEFLNYQGYSGVSTPYILNSVTGYNVYKSLTQADLVINGTLSKKWGIGFNSTYQVVETNKSNCWWGSAIYLNYDPLASLGFTLRGEYFSDKDGIKLNHIAFATIPASVSGVNIYNLTFSTIWKIDNCLTIVPEIRFDNASENIFTKSNASSINSTFSSLIAAVYKF